MSKAQPQEPVNGILVVDKPAGMTSHDVVGITRKLFRTKRVGHTGTLDPDATGVLVLCLGQATRLAEYLSAARKRYIATVVFGIETTTQDTSGQITAEQNAAHVTQEIVAQALATFRGDILQVPPMVSALHHEGQRLYDLARQGIEVERAARPIRIDLLDLLDFTPGAHPAARLDVVCSTGTYIRALAADIGTAVGTGAAMQTLRRVWVGEGLDEPHRPFALEHAHTLDDLRARAADNTLQAAVLPLTDAIANWPQAELNDAQVARIRHGQTVGMDDISVEHRRNWSLLNAPHTPPVALLDARGELIALARLQSGALQPHKVFAA